MSSKPNDATGAQSSKNSRTISRPPSRRKKTGGTPTDSRLKHWETMTRRSLVDDPYNAGEHGWMVACALMRAVPEAQRPEWNDVQRVADESVAITRHLAAVHEFGPPSGDTLQATLDAMMENTNPTPVELAQATQQLVGLAHNVNAFADAVGNNTVEGFAAIMAALDLVREAEDTLRRNALGWLSAQVQADKRRMAAMEAAGLVSLVEFVEPICELHDC